MHFIDLNFIGIAHAAGELTTDTLKQIYDGIVLWIAGIFVLIAAIYLPFQIGGIGKSIIDGIGKIYKTGVDNTKWAASKAGGFAYRELGGKEIVGAAKSKYLGPLLAAGQHWKSSMAKYTQKQDRLNTISGGIGAGDWQDVTRNTDRNDQSRWKYQEDIESIERKIQSGVIGDGDWDNFNIKNGTKHGGKIQEDATNLFLTLREWAKNPGTYPDKYKEAQGVLNKWDSMGFGFDNYGNFRKIGDSKGDGDKNDPYLVNSLLSSAGLNKNDIEALRVANTDTDIKAIVNKVDPERLTEINKQIPQIFGTSVKDFNDLAVTYNNNIKTELGNEYGKYTSMLQNTPPSVLKDINSALQQDKIKAALEIANLNNVTLVQEKIKSLPKDYMGNYIPSLDSFLLKHSFDTYQHSKEVVSRDFASNPLTPINNVTDSSGNIVKIGFEELYKKQPASLKIIEKFEQLNNHLQTDMPDIHTSVINNMTTNPIINNSSSPAKDITNARIEAVITSEKLDHDYAKEIFGEEVATQVMSSRTINSSGQVDITPEARRKIQAKIQKNRETITNNMIIYNTPPKTP